MAEYITTFEKLNEVSLGKLGNMAPGTTYDQFMAQAQRVAQEKGVEHPVLMLAMTYRNNTSTQLDVIAPDKRYTVEMNIGGQQVVYPVVRDEWNQFVADTPTYLTEQPEVHTVDGDLFTAMI